MNIDEKNLVVKFWTGNLTDEDVDCFIERDCTILQPALKPVDKYGFWYRVRKYRVKLKRGRTGELLEVLNAITLGPYSGRIFYPGQVLRCFIRGLDYQECAYIQC
jgi:hypothetical protein